MGSKAATNVIKTTILIVVVSLLAAGVYFSISRIGSKPPKAPDTNQFVEALDESVKQMCNLMDKADGANAASALASIGEEYNLYSSKLRLYKKESLISEDEYKKEIENLDGSFAKKYANYYLNRFKSTPWGPTDIANVRTMVADLNSFGLQNSVINDLSEIIRIYDQVLAQANNLAICTSTTQAKARIAQCRSYLSNEYIRNNAQLCSMLSNMPQRMGESHYKHLENQVAALSPHAIAQSRMLTDEASERINQVYNEIHNYNNLRSSVYGNNVRSADNLLRTLERYINDINNRTNTTEISKRRNSTSLW